MTETNHAAGVSAPQSSGEPNAEREIRVVLVDTQPLYREGLADLMADHPLCGVVACVDSGEAALAACLEHSPDVIVVGLSLGGLAGTDLIAKVLEAFPAARVVALSRHLDTATAWGILRMGANGLLSKEVTLEELLSATFAVHGGGIYLCSHVQGLIVRGAVRNGEQEGTGRWAQLSRREREVAEQLVAGRTPRQIAEQLSLKIKTVDSHRYQLLQKLGLGNVADLTRLAVLEGVVQP